jgi:hypothetical protein
MIIGEYSCKHPGIRHVNNKGINFIEIFYYLQTKHIRKSNNYDGIFDVYIVVLFVTFNPRKFK